MTLQGLLDYYNLTIINEPEKIRNYTKLELKSIDGYKYYFSKNDLYHSYRRNNRLSKYFRGNPYTEYNLSNFLMLETNGDVVIKDFRGVQNNRTPILLHCNSINLDYSKNIGDIVAGNYYLKMKMPDWESHKKLNIEYVKKEGYKYGVEIVDTEYISSATPLKFICLKHRNIGVQERSWAEIRVDKFPCKYCHSEFLAHCDDEPTANAKERFELTAPKFKNQFIEIIGEYKGCKDKIECKCLRCGKHFYLRPEHIKGGVGHSGCHKPLGEERLEKYLEEHNINYIWQYHFGDCIRRGRDMPFDFYLPDLNIAIEYDGAQHYRPVSWFGGEEAFSEQKLRDKFKTDYCIEHNVKLIRIPYTEYNNMEEFLNNCFNKD